MMFKKSRFTYLRRQFAAGVIDIGDDHTGPFASE
jgi:hypothetical protein